MAKFALADPVFAKAVKALSEEAQRNLVENGLSDPGVLDAYLRGIRELSLTSSHGSQETW